MNVTLIKSILLANSNDASLIYLPCFKLNYFFLLILSPNNCNEKQITDCRWAKNAACCTLSSVDLCTALNKRLWLLGLDKEGRAWVVTRRWPWQTQTPYFSLYIATWTCSGSHLPLHHCPDAGPLPKPHPSGPSHILYGAKCALGITFACFYHPRNLSSAAQYSSDALCSCLDNARLEQKDVWYLHSLSYPSPGFMNPLRVGETR